MATTPAISTAVNFGPRPNTTRRQQGEADSDGDGHRHVAPGAPEPPPRDCGDARRGSDEIVRVAARLVDRRRPRRPRRTTRRRRRSPARRAPPRHGEREEVVGVGPVVGGHRSDTGLVVGESEKSSKSSWRSATPPRHRGWPLEKPAHDEGRRPRSPRPRRMRHLTRRRLGPVGQIVAAAMGTRRAVPADAAARRIGCRAGTGGSVAGSPGPGGAGSVAEARLVVAAAVHDIASLEGLGRLLGAMTPTPPSGRLVVVVVARCRRSPCGASAQTSSSSASLCSRRLVDLGFVPVGELVELLLRLATSSSDVAVLHQLSSSWRASRRALRTPTLPSSAMSGPSSPAPSGVPR